MAEVPDNSIQSYAFEAHPVLWKQLNIDMREHESYCAILHTERLQTVNKCMKKYKQCKLRYSGVIKLNLKYRQTCNILRGIWYFCLIYFILPIYLLQYESKYIFQGYMY